MNREKLLKYGNELTICGFVVGNGNEVETILFPGESIEFNDNKPRTILFPTDEEIHQIIRQLDVQEIEGLQKVILRKSQRNIDQRVAWEVYRRDNFTCVYCEAKDVPMTIDHIVLWEHMGDTVPDNLNCSCKKCNKTRGSMDYDNWLDSDYMTSKICNSISPMSLLEVLELRGDKAKKVPLRKTKRSR